MQLRERLAQSSEYRNWVEVGQALLILSGTVQAHLSIAIRALYNVLTVKAGRGTRCHCTHAPEMHDTLSCKWAKAIMSYHREPSKIKWRESNSSKWHDPISGPWEIAFVFAGGKTVDGIRNLRLLRSCSYFSMSEKVLGDVVNVWRKLWGNAPNQKISQQDKRRAFDAVATLLLQLPFKNEADRESVLKEIESIEFWDLPVLQVAEVKVVRSYQNMLQVKRLKITKDIMDLDTCLDNVEYFLSTKKVHDCQHTSVPLQDSLFWLINFVYFSRHWKTPESQLALCRFLTLLYKIVVIVVLMVLAGSVTMLLSVIASGLIERCVEPSCV